MSAPFLKYLCVGAQEYVAVIEYMLEEIYGEIVYNGIQDIIGGIDPVISVEAGGTCTGQLWIGGSVEQLVCIINDV